MTIFLNVLFMAVSVLYLLGRLFEINTVMDPRTGFLVGKGIVTTPSMAAVVCVIAVCCGIIMFASEKQGKKIRTMPVGILGIMAGVFFVAGGILNSLNCFKYGGFILYHGMEALGGIGLILLGIMNIKGEGREKIPVLFTLFIPVGTCMNSVLHEIKTIRDTDYLMRSLAGICALIFLTFLFKTAYFQDKLSKIMLYISGLICFLFAGMGSFAALVGGVMTGTANLLQLLYNVGYTFIGLYAVFIAFFISPDKIEHGGLTEEEIPASKPAKRQGKASDKEVPRYNFSQSGNINQAVIDELFAKKDARESENEKPTHTEKASAAPEPAAEKTTVVTAGKEKAVFKGDGKKSRTKKVVYKAPK